MVLGKQGLHGFHKIYSNVSGFIAPDGRSKAADPYLHFA